MKYLLSILVLFAAKAEATLYYVCATNAASGNGTSWATAWKNSQNIVWSSIAAGDTIYFHGEPSGSSYQAFSTITANGTAGNYITIARSTESGRDGIVTIATPFGISGNYIKFDGGAFKAVASAPTGYRCGIVFTCSGITTTAGGGSFTGGQSVNCGGALPWFKYCYFNGTYGSGAGNSFGVNNATGFILEDCWFYQSAYEDQMSFQATTKISHNFRPFHERGKLCHRPVFAFLQSPICLVIL